MNRTEVSLTDSIKQNDIDITIKEDETVEHVCLMNNTNNIQNELVGQSVSKEECIKYTPVKTDIHKQKNTDEDIKITSELVTEAGEIFSPKKECFDGEDNLPFNIEKILSSPMREVQNLLKKESDSPIESLKTDQFEESFGEILRTPKFDKHGYSQNNTPEKLRGSQKKRKVSISSDSSSKSVKIKFDTVLMNELEPMTFVHDFDSLIEFEDCKIPSDLLLSSVMFDNLAQGTAEDSRSLNMEQSTDPLFIEELESPKGKCKSTKMKDCPEAVYPKKQTRLRTRMQERRRCSSKKRSIENLDESTIAEDIKEQLETIKEKEEFPMSVINKLKHLTIQLTHIVPPQHKIERYAGSHVPTQEESKKFQEYGPLRKGKFLPAEDEIIQNNWKSFCKIHGWDVKNTKPFQHMRHDGRYYISKFTERQKFVQFLANGLPWRTLYSVYSRFKVLNRNYKIQKKFTAEEDKKILACMQNDSLKENEKLQYWELAKVLGRSTHSIFSRLRLLKRRQKMARVKNPIAQKVKWTLHLIEKFVKHLVEVTLSENVDELKDAVIPKAVWLKMEKVLCISSSVLRTFWQYQLHMQLFCPHPIYLNDIKIQLIEYMYGKGIGHKREINWSNVAKHFDGMTSMFLSSIFCQLLRSAGIDIQNENFADVVECLYHCVIIQIREEHVDKFLPRLRYTNNTIQIIDKIPDKIDV